MPNIKNRPCICGSGLEFSKCCGKSEKISHALLLGNTLLRDNNKQSLYAANNGQLWEGNRKSIYDLIFNNLNKELYSKVAILGAGNCKDIPFDLLQHCQSIHLYDIDWESISSFRTTLPEDIKKKTSAKLLDISGLWTTSIPELLNYIEHNDFFSAIDYLEKISGKQSKMPIIKSKYDLVLSINVTTQLLFPFFLFILHMLADMGKILRYSPYLNFLESLESYHNIDVVKHHLAFIKFISKPGGNIIITTDKYENGIDYFGPKYNPQIKTPTDMLVLENQKNMKQLIGSTIDNYIRDYFSNVMVNQWIWQFSPDRAYLIEGFAAYNI